MKEYDFVFTSKPVNKTASIVLKKGEGFKYSDKTPWTRCSTEPIKTKKFQGPAEYNLTGKKYGNLIVTGYFGKSSGTGGAGSRWVCKCTCGNYSVFRATVLKKGKATKCHDCKKIDYYRAKGI
jgi:hypothetical protein